MKSEKSYLDFTPQNLPGPRFRDLNYTAYDVNITKSRRLHLAAYFKFMRPEVSYLYDEYAVEARKRACKVLYKEAQQRDVPVPYFEYLVDNVFWKLWFSSFGPDAPLWPWGPAKTSMKLKPGERPSRTYAEYCKRRANEASSEGSRETSRETSRDANACMSISQDQLNPDSSTDPNSQYILWSQAVFTMSEHDKPEPDMELKKREAAWEKLEPFEHEPGVVGPFEVELPSLIPIETLVVQDLASINTLCAGHAIIKVNMTRRRVIVSFPVAEDENEVRLRHFIVWGHVRGWVDLINQKKYVTLCEHLQGVL